MVYFQLSLGRIITVYIAQGVILVAFLYLAIRILLRDRKRLNVIFAGLYISPAIGVLINFLYAPLTDESIVLLLNFVTNFGFFYSPIFIVVFDLMLLKSEKVISTTKQLIILIAYGIALFCMLFFLFIPGFGVSIGPSTSWSPVWSLPFFIYVTLVETIGAVIPSLYFSFQIYKKFEDEVLKKKWKSFIYGIIALLTFMYGIFISNFLGDPTIRLIIGVMGLILAIFGGFLMYFGVGKQIEK
jgi:small neutral amino acid transporter SnatA (MarC family)